MTYMIAFCMFCLTILPTNASNTGDKKLIAYPNPIYKSAVLTVEIPDGEYSDLTVVLYNTVGKQIYSLKTTTKTVEFNVPDISGIYFLRIVENQKVIAIEKIIVKE